MKKRNPIRNTVTNFVAATGRPRCKPTKSKLALFFEDLENRGPFAPNSLFDEWTTSVRLAMVKAGTWVGDDQETNLEFVAEYIGRMQRKFFDFQRKRFGRVEIHDGLRTDNSPEEAKMAYRTLKMIYIKVRVWGLRVKKFRLKKWRKAGRTDFTLMTPIPLKKEGSEPYAYVIQPWGDPCTFFVHELIKYGGCYHLR